MAPPGRHTEWSFLIPLQKSKVRFSTRICLLLPQEIQTSVSLRKKTLFGEMKPQLPLALLGRAFIASNGELAWARGNVSEAIDAYAAEKAAVMGFEASVSACRGSR